MSIAAAEDWLVTEIRRVLGSAFRSIESGPGEWSEDYLKRVVEDVPAVRVAWLGGAGREATMLTLDTRWAVYVLTGWDGGTQHTRRRGRTGEIGAYRATELLAPRLHTALIPDVGRVRVASVENFWTGAIDRKGLALYAVILDIAIPMDVEIGEGEYEDFLRVGIDWPLGEGVGGDATDTMTLPQAENS